MRDLEHLFAIYYDDYGCSHTLSAEDLSDDRVFEKAKDLILYDASEQSILVPRDISGKEDISTNLTIREGDRSMDLIAKMTKSITYA